MEKNGFIQKDLINQCINVFNKRQLKSYYNPLQDIASFCLNCMFQAELWQYMMKILMNKDKLD